MQETDSPGVYFGPFQSPEKKFLARLNLNLEPNRPYLQLSQPVASASRDNHEAGDLASGDAIDASDDENPHRSTSVTPESDHLPLDEPSSALADRIIRAHDNPSPPPRPVEFPDLPADEPFVFLTTDNLALPAPSLSHSPAQGTSSAEEDNTAQSNLNFEAFPNFDFNESPMPVFPSLASLRNPPPSPQPAADRTLQHDLISFNSFLAPVPDQLDAPQLGPLTPAPVFLPDKGMTTVDDLLATSPSPLKHVPRLGLMDGTIVPPLEIPPFKEPATSDSIIDSDVYRPKQSETPHVVVDSFAPPESLAEAQISGIAQGPILAPTPIPALPLAMPVSFEESAPPLRRSPRRSTTPQPQPLVTPPPQTRRKRARGRESLLPVKEVASDSEEDRGRSASAEPDRGRFVSPCEQKPADGEKAKGKRRDNGHAHASPERAAYSRELGSLSPESTTQLTQLLWPIKESEPSAGISPARGGSAQLDALQRPTFPVFRPPEQMASNLFVDAINTTAPLHTPTRILAPPSKAKPETPREALNTPARRVMLTPKMRTGHPPFKPSGGVGPMSRAGPFAQPSPDDPMQSPRRVPLDSMPKLPPRVGSPVRQFFNMRSVSEEPTAPKGTNVKVRTGSAEPMASVTSSQDEAPGPSSKPRPVSESPSPIVVAGRPAMIPEVGKSPASLGTNTLRRDGDDKPTVVRTSPTKSNLRQPSSRSTSRIPRIGAKPYARPPTAKKALVVRKVVDSVPESQATSGLARSGSGSDSSSDAGAKTPISAVSSGRTRTVTSTTATVGNMKGKREAPKPPAQNARIQVRIRAVPPDPIPPKPIAAPQPHYNVQRPPQAAVIRRVPDMPVVDPAVVVSHETHAPEESAKDLVAMLSPPSLAQATVEEERPLSPNSETTPPSSPVKQATLPPAPHRRERSAHTAFFSAALPIDDGPDNSRRRTTRPRKPSQAENVAGNDDTRPVPRRKPNVSTRPDVFTFSEMSAMALKALTSSNTVRNQQYLVAKLETEVVRVDGARPESPAIKIRTIAQKEMENQKKGRQERATRRARRSEDWNGDSLDGWSEREDSSSVGLEGDTWGAADADAEQPPPRHRRGPGDEEDYETPEKLVKRLRLRENEDGTRETKRVKWDRGLSKTIYLDELRPGERARPQDHIIKKGCLAPAAKTVRLDTLGNILNADTPLGDLVHENIVVKKFVYDTDLKNERLAARATRGRSKKSKS